MEQGKGRCRNSDGGKTSGGLSGPVIWPGDLNGRDPKGWAMPSEAKPMRIIVPKRTSFNKFVTFQTGEEWPVGFCVDLFDEVVNFSLISKITRVISSFLLFFSLNLAFCF